MADVRRILAVEMATEGRRSRHSEIENLLNSVVGPDFTVKVSLLPEGPKSLESGFDIALAGPGILKRVQSAEREGFSAVLLCGALDPCVDYAREATRIPVVGAGGAACLTAASLGKKIGIVAPTHFHFTQLRNVISRVGLRDEVILRALGIEIPNLRKDLDRTLERLIEEGKAALSLACDVIVLGCTSISESGVRQMETALGVPVVHPNIAGTLWAANLVRGGWSQSARAYGFIEDLDDRYGGSPIEFD